MLELKPCPFCASSDIKVIKKFSSKLNYAMCYDCGSMGANGFSEDQGIELWNARAGETNETT